MEGKDVRAAAPRSGSRRTLEGTRVVIRHVWRTSSLAYPERIRTTNVGKRAFVDRPREGSGGIANAKVAKDKDGIRTALPRRGSKETQTGMPAVKRASGKKKRGGQDG